MTSPHTARWLLLVLACVAGCDLPGKPDRASYPVPADQVKDFAALYATRCAGCHGAEGKLGPAPPLNDSRFLAIVPDNELLRVIREGRRVNASQKTPMPAFARERGGPLTDAQVQILAAGLKKKWVVASPSEKTPPYLRPESAKPGDKKRGDQVFVMACAECHGMDGGGGKMGDHDVGAVNDQAFLALISDQALRRIIITGRDDLGMPGYDGTHGRDGDFEPLTSRDVDDLVALLASWRESPQTGSD